ncbi:MAG TPA: class I SAM-dependent methyltransferase [Acidimicrobiales bacterium]|nr:class I SAM-dependent methyltransferase [Acidimicrobiales bacterium]
MSGLLLYSLAEFRELILQCLDIVGARSVVEIGGEGGTFTSELLAWAEARGATVRCIDPAPSDALVRMIETSPSGELLRARSADVLDDLETADVYLVDGDHNYHTLSVELRAIDGRKGDRHPLLFLHDVGWPAGRRDMYYDPGSLPPEAVHPYDYERGVTVGCPGLVVDGFRGEGEFAWARDEGGPANGVLTAIEDFLAERTELRFRTIPCIFGLGVLYAEDAPYAAEVDAALAPYVDNPLLARMEQNRVALYLRVLEQQHETAAAHRRAEDWALRLRDVEVENRALWARIAELEAQLARVSQRYEALAREVETTVSARSFAVAEGLSRLHHRIGHTHGVSGQRLRALLGGAEADGDDGGRGELAVPSAERTTPRSPR